MGTLVRNPLTVEWMQVESRVAASQVDGVGCLEMDHVMELARQVYDIRIVVNIDHVPKLYEKGGNKAQSWFTR